MLCTHVLLSCCYAAITLLIYMCAMYCLTPSNEVPDMRCVGQFLFYDRPSLVAATHYYTLRTHIRTITVVVGLQQCQQCQQCRSSKRKRKSSFNQCLASCAATADCYLRPHAFHLCVYVCVPYCTMSILQLVPQEDRYSEPQQRSTIQSSFTMPPGQPDLPSSRIYQVASVSVCVIDLLCIESAIYSCSCCCCCHLSSIISRDSHS